MYQVNLGEKILYYPASEDACIYDTELNEDVGQAGEFTFKVPSSNPLYSELSQGSLITIYRDKKEFWRGEIKDISVDFAKVATVYCVEDLTWLNEEYLAPASITNETYSQRLLAAITAYNANRPADRQFEAGYITNVINTNFCNWTTEYEQPILEQLRNCICDASSPQGQIRVRRVTSGGTVTRYIDIVKLADYGIQATQPIEYGYNLLDYVKETDFGNLVNVLTPYGAELDTQVYDEYNARLQGTTITDATSIGVYGRHAKDVVFDNVSDLTNLNDLAQSYLTRYSQPQLTMEVEAVDLAGIENVDAISIGDSVRIIAQPFAVDQWLYLTEIRRDIQNIDKNKITLSGNVQTGRTLTSQTQGTQEAVKKIPSKSEILEAAKKNALEILNGTDGGYVTFETNADDQITELRIANNLDINQATKCWKWNLGGLGYMSRDTAADPWAVVTAATMDGEIVADFITTGTMLADRILGGTLTLGGVGNTNGVESVRDADNVECVRISNEGIDIKKGLLAGLTVNQLERGLSFSGDISGFDNYFKLTAYGGITCGREQNNSWQRMDYVTGYGMLKVDYGASDTSLRGIVVTNAGNNTYNNPGDHYIHIKHNNVWSKDYGSVSWAGSDKQLKKNIKDLTLNKAKKLINSVHPREFEFKSRDGKRYGFIAQELKEVLDDNSGIEFETDGLCNINYNDFIAPLCMMVKDLQEQINELKGEKDG